MNHLKNVRLLMSQTINGISYGAGERAGFTQDLCENLIKHGRAEWPEEEVKSAEVKNPEGAPAASEASRQENLGGLESGPETTSAKRAGRK